MMNLPIHQQINVKYVSDQNLYIVENSPLERIFYLLLVMFHKILLNNGERGDSNPRIAAPQAAALTTWRRPPHIYKFTNSALLDINVCAKKDIF